MKARLRAKLTPILAGLRLASLLPALPALMSDRKLVETCRSWCDGGDIELTLSAGEHHARLVRLRVRSHTTAAHHTTEQRSASSQVRIAEALRVHPGPAVRAELLPSVSVVIPTLDGREVLTTCLASLAEVRYPREELSIIVVDNGSSDDTLAFLRERHPHVEIVAFDRNRGFASACNAGARAAGHSSVVVFLNNDMRVAQDFLIELVSPIARGECAATVAKRLSWDGSLLDGAGVGSTFGGIAVQPGYGLPPGTEHAIHRRTLFPCGGAMAVLASVFRDVGGFDEEFFAYYEDLDLGWRMWVMDHATHYVPSAVAYHHHSHTSRRFPPASVRLVMIRNSLLACVKNYDDENLARVLPVVLALASRRAAVGSGIAGGGSGDARSLRIENATAKELAPSGMRAIAEAPFSIHALGAADLVAIDDLLGRWEHWIARRNAVQVRRRRHDRDILPMFLDPLACVEADPAYRALQECLVARFGIDRMFAAASSPRDATWSTS